MTFGVSGSDISTSFLLPFIKSPSAGTILGCLPLINLLVPSYALSAFFTSPTLFFKSEIQYLSWPFKSFQGFIKNSIFMGKPSGLFHIIKIIPFSTPP